VTNGRDLRGERLTIVGAGAIGGTVGAYLDDAGYDVLLVDADPAHVTVVKERGLKITGCRGEKTFRPRIVLPEDLNGSLGAVFLCVKGHHTASAMDQIAPQLAPKGWILSLQNGLNETQIAERVGSARTVGAFVHFGADLLEPGLIQLGYEATIRVGELGGSFTPRLEALKTTLGYAMPCEITDNVWGYLWGKLVFGSLGFLVSCVDAPVAEVVEDPLGRALCREVCTEAYLVARTQTEKVEPIGGFDPEAFAPGACRNKRADGALDALADAWRHSLKQHMGIWRDLRVKRRKTEVDEQVARVVATGGEERVPVPVNEAVLGVVHDIEEGRRGMGWENLEEISRRAGYY
jgi:2-dehydropantoate 2-reductase